MTRTVKLDAFAQHYGFEPRACKAHGAKTKGKFERPYRYIRQDFFLARRFQNLADMNRQLREWHRGRATILFQFSRAVFDARWADRHVRGGMLCRCLHAARKACELAKPQCSAMRSIGQLLSHSSRSAIASRNCC